MPLGFSYVEKKKIYDTNKNTSNLNVKRIVEKLLARRCVCIEKKRCQIFKRSLHEYYAFKFPRLHFYRQNDR